MEVNIILGELYPDEIRSCIGFFTRNFWNACMNRGVHNQEPIGKCPTLKK